MIPLPYKIIAALVLLAALTAGYFGWQTHQRSIGAEAQKQVDAQAIQAQKDEAAKVLSDETAKVRATEKTLRAFVDAQEVQNVKANQKITELNHSLHDSLVDGRLRDPYARSGDCSSTAESGTAAAPSNSSSNGAPNGGLLSKQLTEFLLNQGFVADQINIAYAACRSWALEVKMAVK